MSKKNDFAELNDGAVYVLQAGTPVYLKTADVCRMFGKSAPRITQLVNQGTLIKTGTEHKGMFELNDTVQRYIRMLEEKAEENSSGDDEALKLKSEAKFKQAKAAIAAMDAKERMGTMHRSEDVAAMTEDLIYSIRSALLALPGRLAVDVTECKDTAEASEIIRNEIYKVMEELSNYEYDPNKYMERVRERLRLEAFEDNTEY